MNDSNWNASAFFEDLTRRNKLAQEKGFRFCRVSGLDGFEEALQAMLSTTAFVCVSDLSQGLGKPALTPCRNCSGSLCRYSSKRKRAFGSGLSISIQR